MEGSAWRKREERRGREDEPKDCLMFARANGKSLFARTQTRAWLLSTKPFLPSSFPVARTIFALFCGSRCNLQLVNLGPSPPSPQVKPRADQVEIRFYSLSTPKSAFPP